MEKKYTSTVTSRAPRPRSERLRKLGGSGGSFGGTTVVNIAGGSTTPAESHTHSNLATLERVGADDNGYLYLDNLKETAEGDGWTNVREKARAGYADCAGRAVESDCADDSVLWDGHGFDDYVDQPVRHDDDVEFRSVSAQDIHTQGFVSGMESGTGAGVDADGNAEVESLRVRSFMEVYELNYNRLNALEGNTSFADVGTIETVEQHDDGTCVLVMRKRWNGDYTAFQHGDVSMDTSTK